MKSLRTKITLITVTVVSIAIFIVASLCVVFIRNTEHKKSDQLLLLLAQTGKTNLDYYFNSVQKSVGKVSDYAKSNFTGIDDTSLENHIVKLKEYFDEIASKTNGVLTYYYRIDPEISSNVKGFWYIDNNGNGFIEHEVTDISQYDTSDTSSLVWFTVPKYEKKAIWISPYVTENLDKKVISYNEPIYYRGTFVGVIGIELDYTIMSDQVNSIKLFGNGYAFLSDSNGNIFYHPKYNSEKDNIITPKELLSDSTFISYSFEGVLKESAWLPLTNGMRINVTVPVSEMEGDWQRLIVNIVIISLEVLIISTLIIMLYSRRISKPLRELTEAAEQVDNGNYDFELKYDKKDELGRLTRTFVNLSTHMKENINDLNKQAFIDSMTQIKNKAAFTVYTQKLQKRLENDNSILFSIGIFDCNDLKKVNDKYGHDKGDIYLKTVSHAIRVVFHNSQVFRIGGDEFAVILENDDYDNKDLLIKRFENQTARINSETDIIWEKINVAYGFAEYNHTFDRDVDEVIRRADKLMYDDKNIRKSKQKNEE